MLIGIGMALVCAALILSVARRYLRKNRDKLRGSRFMWVRRCVDDPEAQQRYSAAGALCLGVGSAAVGVAEALCVSAFYWLIAGLSALLVCVIYATCGRRKVLGAVAEMAGIACNRLVGGKGGR